MFLLPISIWRVSTSEVRVPSGRPTKRDSRQATARIKHIVNTYMYVWKLKFKQVYYLRLIYRLRIVRSSWENIDFKRSSCGINAELVSD